MIVDVINSLFGYSSHRVSLPAACLPISKYGSCNIKGQKSKSKLELEVRKKKQVHNQHKLPLMPIKADKATSFTPS